MHEREPRTRAGTAQDERPGREAGAMRPAPVRPVVDVLVVDDDPAIARLLSVHMSKRSMQATTVGDGHSALAHVAAHPTDLVFLDLVLPDIDGLEVLERLKEHTSDIAVVLMTAYGSERTAVGALRHLADDYLPKPFRADELQAVIDRTTRRLDLKRQNVALREHLEVTNDELQAELARAGQIQARLLPDDAPYLPGFELAGRCLPSRSVGGDFYDWLEPVPGVLTLAVSDVMGHGMPAALTMAEVRAVLRTLMRHASPAEALTEAATTVGGDLERSGQYATAFVARLDTSSRTLTFADAGHGHAALVRGDGRVDDLHPRGYPLGLFPGERYADVSTTLHPEDTLVVYSDGLLDGVPRMQRERHALAEIIAGTSGAADAVDRLVDAGTRGGPLTDDLTVVVLRGHAG